LVAAPAVVCDLAFAPLAWAVTLTLPLAWAVRLAVVVAFLAGAAAACDSGKATNDTVATDAANPRSKNAIRFANTVTMTLQNRFQPTRWAQVYENRKKDATTSSYVLILKPIF
jgi:hypothetical protein